MQIEILDIGKNQLLAFLKIAQKHQDQVVLIPKQNEIDFKFDAISHTNVGYLKLKKDIHYKMENLEDVFVAKQFERNIKDISRILSHLKNQSVSLNTEIEDDILTGISFD